MNHAALILASGSPRRRELLSLTGLPYVVDAPEVDGCTLTAYEGTLHFPVVLIQRGNVFLYAYFYQFDDPGSYILPLDEWIGILARSLQEA